MPQELLRAIFIFVHYLNVTSLSARSQPVKMSRFQGKTWGKHVKEFAMGVQALSKELKLTSGWKFLSNGAYHDPNTDAQSFN
jgi:hypothetical protein